VSQEKDAYLFDEVGGVGVVREEKVTSSRTREKLRTGGKEVLQLP